MSGLTLYSAISNGVNQQWRQVLKSFTHVVLTKTLLPVEETRLPACTLFYWVPIFCYHQVRVHCANLVDTPRLRVLNPKPGFQGKIISDLKLPKSRSLI